MFLLFAITSCQEDLLFEENLALENTIWKAENQAYFDVDIQDTLSLYNVRINLRNTEEYRFSNIYLFVTINFPNGKKSMDTLDYYLADKTGKWYGSGLGDLYDNDFPMINKMAFPLKGTYRIEIVHAMRDEDLEGIANVGLKVAKHLP